LAGKMNRDSLREILKEIRRSPNKNFTPEELRKISELFDLLLER